MPTHVTVSELVVMDGPSADKVIDAFKYAFSDRPDMRLNVEFTVAVSDRLSRPLYVQVTGLKYESGSEGMFIIEGNSLNGAGKIQGTYNAKRRHGTLTLVQ